MRKGYIDGPHGQIHYWTLDRTGGKGPNLVLLHQASQSSEEFQHLAPLLADTFNVVGFDFPGYGQSYDPPYDYQMDDLTAAALSVIDGLGIEKMSLFGHHGGSSVAIDIAGRRPEAVEKIILSGSGVRSPEETEKLLKQTEGADLSADKEGAELSAMWKRYQVYARHAPNAETQFQAYLVSLVHRARAYDAHAAILRWDRKKALAKVSCPVLLVQGSEDTFVQRQEELLDVIPGSRRMVVPDAGVFAFYEKPEVYAKLIADFLSE